MNEAKDKQTDQGGQPTQASREDFADAFADAFSQDELQPPPTPVQSAPGAAQRKAKTIQLSTQELDHRFVGVELDGYGLVRQVAVGGMGFIYQAQLLDDPDVLRAVKVLRPELAHHEILVKRFEREARIMSRLAHPRIVGIHGSGRSDKVGHYMILDWLYGQTLKERYRAHRELFPQKLLYRWIEQIGHALHFTHQKGVIHRDIKPDNIFLLSEGDTKSEGLPKSLRLIDFGIATAEDEPDFPGERVGTPRYMAPEQIRNEAVSPKTDIYAFGNMLFEMLTRRPVFNFTRSEDLKRAHLEIPPPTLAKARPDLTFPEELETFVKSLLAKDPDARPSSIPDFFQQLAPILLREQIQRRKGPLRISVGDAQGPEMADAPTPVPVSDLAPQHKASPNAGVNTAALQKSQTPTQAPPTASNPALDEALSEALGELDDIDEFDDIENVDDEPTPVKLSGKVILLLLVFSSIALFAAYQAFLYILSLSQ